MDDKINKSQCILIIFAFLCLALLIFIIVLYFKIILPRKMPTLIIQKNDVAVRGSVLTQDNYSLARSKKLYKLGFNPRSIDPDKKELFVKLLSIYSDIPESTIQEALKQPKYRILSYAISPNTAANLKTLNAKLLTYNVFQDYEDESGKLIQKMGLSVEVSGVDREYPYENLLEPIVGYTQKDQNGDMTIPKGVGGIEKFQETTLRAISDGFITGKRDIGFNVIYNKISQSQKRLDGFDVRLGISLRLQQQIEEILDSVFQQYQSEEIIAGILNPTNGQILALATTNRFNPKAIKREQYPNLNIKAIESFEPGSTIKPLVYSLLIEKKLINPLAHIDLNNGYYRVGKYMIRDDVIMPKNPTIEDVLLRSSNVGMVKLSMLLSGKEFYDGLRDFGLAQLTGIDLPYEKDGIIPSIRELSQESSAAKASASYGYKIRVTFMQLLRSYGVFLNGGFLVTPHITQNFIAPDGQIYVPTLPQPKQVLSSLSAKKIEELLVRIVENGTGKAAKVEGIIVGGKTGTARVATTSGYGETYTGSFFGFAKDRENTYIIGVVAFGSHGKHYYGGQTAAPIFKHIVEAMVTQGYLKLQKDKK